MVPRDVRKLASASQNAHLTPGEQHWRAIVENAPEMIALISSDGLILYINAYAEYLLGYERQQVERHNIFAYIHPEDSPRAAQEFSNTIQVAGERIPTVLRLRKSSGGYVPVETIANNQLNNPGLRAVIFSARDLRFREDIAQVVSDLNADLGLAAEDRVTELAKINAELRIENQARLRAESELKRTVSLLNAALDSTADGLLVVSTDGIVTGCNQKFLEIWRLGSDCEIGIRDDVVLRQVLEQLENPKEFVEKVRTLYADRSTSSFDVLHFKDGRVFERYSQPQRIDGTIVGRVWSFRDVTHARHMELDLRQAQKMEALGRLAGGVAHDFNNLLMLISGYASQILQSQTLLEARGICDQILATTKRGGSVTRQLLAFSRKLPDSPTITDLNTIVLDMERMLTRLFSNDIQLRIAVDRDPRLVLVDVSQIEMLILNLAINAQDAMSGGGVLSISVGRESLPAKKGEISELRPFCFLEMSDTGHGMNAEVKTHIFEPFFTTKQVGKGTGLGLATVFGIVEHANGHIEVQSEPNQGATFRVYIPEVFNVSAARPIRPVTAPAGGSETILIAEDEDGIRTMTRAYLEGLGYRVIEAEDGNEAVRSAREYVGKIDLVLTDVLMPALRGDKAVEEIRKYRPDAKVLFMSGYTDDLPPSVQNVLYKPFEFPDLGRAIRIALDPHDENR